MNQQISHKIIVDCERMKYPFTGLYYYCLHLTKNLNLTNKDKMFCFYVREEERRLFKHSCTIKQHPLHKFLLPSLKGFSLWHSTFQGTMYFPWHRKIKVVFTIHDLNFLYDVSKTPQKRNKYLALLRAKIQRADHIVAISNYVLNDVRKHIDISEKACSVIYNGCTIQKITSLADPVLKPTASFLFTIGTIIEKKNFHVLPALLQNNNMQLIIAGITDSEEYKAKIIAEAKEFGVDGRVIFAGSISENDKQWYLDNCTAFVFPSIAEGFGLPVVEAMFFGKPVLLSTHTCLPEIGGSAAYYFKNFEPEHMHAVLKNSLEDFTKNKRSESVRNRALLFDWKKSAAQYHEVYDSLLNTQFRA
jgi:glycosyltransferase involved in cell wall biosynthesis